MKKDEVNSQIPVTNTEMVEYVKIKSITLRVFFILLIVFVIIMLAVTGAIYLSFKNKDTISKGVHIKGIDVSGLTKDEAIDKVKSHLDEIMNETISLDYNNKQYYVEVEQIEAMFDTRIGIPNANTDKKERLVTDEINANNVETATMCEQWLDCIKKGIEKANAMYNLTLAVDWRVDPKTDIDDDWKEGADNV